jgi:hypothetical protein
MSFFMETFGADTFPTRREGGEWRETAHCQAAMRDFLIFAWLEW